MIDLHMHSNFSDGYYSPAELVEQIFALGLKAAALTDHDMVDGCSEFKQAASKYNLSVLNGAELSADYSRVPMEILALNIPDKNISAFQEYQKYMINERFRVAEQRLELLKKQGIDLSWNDVAYYENGNLRRQIGKPHIVAAMLKAGYIKNWDEGFDKYLNKGCPAHVAKKEPLYKDVIAFIADNGAIPVLAHPIHTKCEGKRLFEVLKELKKCGLKGVEVFHSDHSVGLKNEYLKMAEELKLISSGGSDFHGEAHPEVKLGVGKGDLYVPDLIFDVIAGYETSVSQAYYNELRKFI